MGFRESRLADLLPLRAVLVTLLSLSLSESEQNYAGALLSIHIYR